MRRFKLLAVVAALMATAAAAASAGTASPAERNFLAFLRPVAGEEADASGMLSFRQPQDAQKIVFLDVVVVNLAPNHSYYLQRATDTAVDDHCTGSNWLTLGRGLVPQAIVTNELGSGGANLFRNLATVPTGMRFDIHFRVIDADDSDVVLASPCYQFTLLP
jgi:hypothetical protein